MRHKTKKLAVRTAAAVIATMDSKGWRARVWENDGWHWSIFKGAIAVHEGSNGKFFTLLASEIPEPGDPPGGGAMLWSGGGSFSDPNEAVKDQLARACRVLTKLAAAVWSAEQ